MVIADGRPSLLFITPVCPSLGGSGSPMRAGIVLEALSQKYRVFLVIAPVVQYQGYPSEIPRALRELCAEVKVISGGGNLEERVQRVSEAYADQKFEIVHVYRLASVPLSRSYLAENQDQRRHLDLDDIESKTQRRIADLYRRCGNAVMAQHQEDDARRLELLETMAFHLFDRIYVCSEVDRRELMARCAQVEGCRVEIAVLRNAMRIRQRQSNVFRFLFVGMLTYYPNADAIRFFCREILPLVREQAREAFVVDVVGSGVVATDREFSIANVNLIGEVPDVGVYYERSDAVIVPLRAGGGTRIKILEAFSYERPVITTTIGVEGIEALPDEHLLVADTAESFAIGCLRLMTDEALRKTLVERAMSLFRSCYTVENLKSDLS